MSDETFSHPGTGRRAKVTSFSKQYAKEHGHGRHYVALFEKGAVTAWRRRRNVNSKRKGAGNA